MALDVQMRKVIDLVEAANAPPLWRLTPDEARKEYAKRAKKLSVIENIFKAEDRVIPVNGSEIKIRI